MRDAAGEWRERVFCKKSRRNAKMEAKLRFFQQLVIQSNKGPVIK
jgi:hypothetical protein